MKDRWPGGGKGVRNVHDFGGLAPLAEPAPQGLVCNIRADLVAQPKGIHDRAGSAVDADGMCVVHRHLVAPDLERGGVE
jgi:hypothetical protein